MLSRRLLKSTFRCRAMSFNVRRTGGLPAGSFGAIKGDGQMEKNMDTTVCGFGA